jgi:hypothetical protein
MFRIKPKLLFGILALAGTAALSPSAQAGFAVGNSVTIGGEPVFSVACPYDGFSPEHRAHLAQDALDNAIATDPALSPDAVKVEMAGGSPTVMLNSHRIITCDFGSAKAEGLTPQQLADRWACNIKAKLAEPNALAYKRSLMLNNPIQSAVITKNETEMDLPRASAIPIRLEDKLATRQLKSGDEVTAVVYENYSCSDLFVPQGTQVFGRVEEVRPGAYEIVFDQLRTPDGTQTRMYGTLSACNISSSAPHPVCTLAIPAGESTEARVPATIAIGATKQVQEEHIAYVIYPSSDVTISTDQNLALILDKVTPVASLQQTF